MYAIFEVGKKDRRLLAENGGPVVLTGDWASYLLVCMEYVKRKANTKMRVTPENFEEHRINLLCDIKGTVTMEDIPLLLILNWDHTGLKYVPISSWTMAIKVQKSSLGRH